MSDPLTLLLAWMAGGALGALFFGGLWWTVRRAVRSKRPAQWFFCSLLVRTSVTLAGLYLVSGGHADRLLVCLLGFVMARLMLMRLANSLGDTDSRPKVEASHAP